MKNTGREFIKDIKKEIDKQVFIGNLEGDGWWLYTADIVTITHPKLLTSHRYSIKHVMSYARVRSTLGMMNIPFTEFEIDVAWRAVSEGDINLTDYCSALRSNANAKEISAVRKAEEEKIRAREAAEREKKKMAAQEDEAQRRLEVAAERERAEIQKNTRGESPPQPSDPLNSDFVPWFFFILIVLLVIALV